MYSWVGGNIHRLSEEKSTTVQIQLDFVSWLYNLNYLFLRDRWQLLIYVFFKDSYMYVFLIAFDIYKNLKFSNKISAEKLESTRE